MTSLPERPVNDDPRPQPPHEPEPGECCQSGCQPCIYDVYWDALERYEQALSAWQARRASLDGS